MVGFDRSSVSGTIRLVREMSQVVTQHKGGGPPKETTPPVFLGFPEGSRARDGRVKEPKLGLFQIAKKVRERHKKRHKETTRRHKERDARRQTDRQTETYWDAGGETEAQP